MGLMGLGIGGSVIVLSNSNGIAFSSVLDHGSFRPSSSMHEHLLATVSGFRIFFKNVLPTRRTLKCDQPE